LKKGKLNRKKYEIFFIFDHDLISYNNHAQMNLTLSRLSAPYHFAIKNASGNTVETDASTDIGGGDAALRPMELLLAGLSSCSSIDVVLLLQKMRQPLIDIRVDIKAERRENEIPSLFEKIHLHFVLYGALEHEKVEKAIDMSIDKYCSVAKILEKTCTITWDFEILPA
jgi:putative redox protein